MKKYFILLIIAVLLIIIFKLFFIHVYYGVSGEQLPEVLKEIEKSLPICLGKSFILNKEEVSVDGVPKILCIGILKNRGKILSENDYSNENENLIENKLVVPSQVPKGTFRNAETGEIFSYVDAGGYLFECRKIDCKSVYFDVDKNGLIIQIREIKENPIIGKIISVDLGDNKSEKANYLIEYRLGDKEYKSTYSQDLCHLLKGGGKQCFIPAEKDQQVMVTLTPDDNSRIDKVIFFNKILKADVLSIVSIDHS